jgi:phage repressor protein C with HTH and peptisase S24 domain
LNDLGCNDLGCNDFGFDNFGLGGQTRPISRPQQAECQWLAKLGRRQTDALRMISISGDSMVPLLEHDDTVMLDCSQTRPSPPGIFILDDGVGLVAKRIEIIPSTTPQMLRISSENSAYSSYQRRIDEVHIIGRVVWFARRL